MDLIRAYSENATATSVRGPLTVTIQAADIPSLTLTNMQVHLPPPFLSSSLGLTKGNITISWSGGTLQSAASLILPITWTDVPGNPSGSYTVPASGNRRFFRVRQ